MWNRLLQNKQDKKRMQKLTVLYLERNIGWVTMNLKMPKLYHLTKKTRFTETKNSKKPRTSDPGLRFA